MGSLEKKLRQALNLSAYEAKIYMAGLDFERATLTELAKAAGIPRTAAYPPLRSLLGRGLVSAVQIKKRKYYRSVNPRQLRYVFDQNRMTLEKVIDELTQEITASEGDFSVRYFAGAGGIQMAGEIFLNESKGKLWKTFEHPGHALQSSDEAYAEYFNERRVAKKIKARMIMPAQLDIPILQKYLERNEKELREIVMVSPDAYPLEASIAVSEKDSMILLFVAKKQKFATLIQSDPLAQTFSSIHDMVWDRYKIR